MIERGDIYVLRAFVSAATRDVRGKARWQRLQGLGLQFLITDRQARVIPAKRAEINLKLIIAEIAHQRSKSVVKASNTSSVLGPVIPLATATWK